MRSRVSGRTVSVSEPLRARDTIDRCTLAARAPFSSRAGFDPEVSRVLEPLFGDRYTVAFEHYPVRDPALREPARVVEAGGS